MPRKRQDIQTTGAATPEEFLKRFAIHLRKFMESHKLSSADVSDRLRAVGVEIGPRGVDVWLRGEGGPRFSDLERIGQALGFSDYRKVLPPPS